MNNDGLKMQTFLPYPNFKKSAKTLDYRRLGKQRVEAYQIYLALTQGSRWKNHPAVKMWKGYENALLIYMNTMIDEWKSRGYKNNMAIYLISGPVVYPPWIGNKRFHISHQSNLLRKDYDFYSKFFKNVPSYLPYQWPYFENNELKWRTT